jgi:hypothetical protein
MTDPAVAHDPASLLSLIDPLLEEVARLDPASRTSAEQIADLESQLRERFPTSSSLMRALEASLHRGVAEGWLCDRGEPQARFCRIAKPTPETRGLSVDIVNLEGAAVEHTHPHGEVTIGFAAGGGNDDASQTEISFDGRPPGWVFLGPGSRHTPTVEGGRMTLMYFLPNGAVQWHMND